MSKRKKNRRNNRRQKSTSNTEPEKVDKTPAGYTIVRSNELSKSPTFLNELNDTLISNTPSTSHAQRASFESQAKKRKNLSGSKTTNDPLSQESLVPSTNRVRSKRRRTTPTHHNNNQSKDDITVTAGTLEVTSSEVAIPQPDFPFPVDPDDHCESPIEAYGDIISFLSVLGTHLYSNSQMLRIYDPYYCDGAVIRNFTSLGFVNVYNRREDCYAIWETASTTANDKSTSNILNQFDVLVTNPPYSEDHIERLIQFVTSDSFVRSQKPWFLLLPQWVHKKDYYIEATSSAKNRRGCLGKEQQTSAVQPFYLIPRKRYIYAPPPNFRLPTKSDVHKKSSPFISMWYCWGGTTTVNEQLIKHYYDANKSQYTCDLARSKSAIRDLRRGRTSKK